METTLYSLPSLSVSIAYAGFWYKWFGGGWQEPQLVLLDHGLIVEIPDTLRQQYCQLWCSFILNDQVAAKAIATSIAGAPSSLLHCVCCCQLL